MANEKKNNYVILGLLSHSTMTGYEIKKRLNTTMRLFWNASYGSIYPTLQLLKKEGHIISSETTEKGRDKIAYMITQKGREYLREWLEKPVVKDELRYETLLKLFFGNEVGATITIEHIQAFEEKIKQELPFLKASVAELKKLDSEIAHRYYMLTAMFGVKTYEAYLEWCEDAKEYLEQEEKISGKLR
ncbi:MAG: PadR family transcriptional regulator [Velocimicrobium sp.]